MTSPSLILTPGDRADRWRFFRDVLVFQGKMLLCALRDFALIPASLAAALLDLVFRGQRQGTLFYAVLKWAAHSEAIIGVYSAVETTPGVEAVDGPNYTVDAMIGRLEKVLVRECEKGGTAATVKEAMDRVFDQIHSETAGRAGRAREFVAQATDKFGNMLGRNK